MTCPDKIECVFVENVILKTGTIKLYKDNVLKKTVTEAGITVSGNSIECDISGEATSLGNYRVDISEGLIESIFGDAFPAFSWAFDIKDAEYESTEYSNEYLN